MTTWGWLMSDRNPKVIVKDNYDGRWTAYCTEHRCTWSHDPDQKTYVNERARAHRSEHRAKAPGQFGWFIKDSKYGRKASQYFVTEADARAAWREMPNRRRYSVDGHTIPEPSAVTS